MPHAHARIATSPIPAPLAARSPGRGKRDAPGVGEESDDDDSRWWPRVVGACARLGSTRRGVIRAYKAANRAGVRGKRGRKRGASEGSSVVSLLSPTNLAPSALSASPRGAQKFELGKIDFVRLCGVAGRTGGGPRGLEGRRRVRATRSVHGAAVVVLRAARRRRFRAPFFSAHSRPATLPTRNVPNFNDQHRHRMATIVLTCGGVAAGSVCRLSSKHADAALLADASWDAEANVLACRVPAVSVLCVCVCAADMGRGARGAS